MTNERDKKRKIEKMKEITMTIEDFKRGAKRSRILELSDEEKKEQEMFFKKCDEKRNIDWNILANQFVGCEKY